MAIVRPIINDDLQTVILPESIKVIGDRAFEYCKSLREIRIPSSTLYIGARAFCGCSNLVKVELSEGLHYIGEEAFRDCSSLRSIHIPENVKVIKEGAFWNCSRLSRFSSVYSPDGRSLVYNGKLIGFAEFGLYSYSVPEGVEEICNEVFSYTKVSEIVLPKSLKKIDEEAFRFCSIKKMSIPYGVQVIPRSAFGGCKNLRELNLPNSIVCIQEWAFGGTSIDRIEIPESVKRIEDHAFDLYHLQNGVEIIIRGSIESVGYSVFGRNCEINRIIIPQGTYDYYYNLLHDYRDLLKEN